MRKAKGLNLISILLIVSLAVMSLTAVFPYVYSYFTATAREQGDLTFGSIGLNMLDEYGDLLSSETFQENYLYGIDPGSTLDLNGIEIENSGENDAYALVNVDVEISNGTTKLNYNKWYNVEGMEVNVNSFAANVAEATLIGKASSATANIAWTFPGDALDNTYQNATAKVSVGAYGMQTLMPKEKEFYVGSDALFASYFICTNATEIQADNPGKNKFNEELYDELGEYTTGEHYAYAPIQLEPNTTYCLSVVRYNYYEGTDGFLLISNKNVINNDWSAITHLSRPDNLYNNGVYTTSDDGLLYIGYHIQTGMTQGMLTNIWTNTDVQIEKGTTATEYEPYDTTTHNEITSTPLMTVGGVSDTASNAQSIVRNVKKVELTGEETGWSEYANSNEGLSFRIDFSGAKIGFQTSRCSHFENVNGAWYDGNKNKYLIYSDHNTVITKYFRAPNSSVTNVDGWKAYLKSEYEAGHPVTIWYQLATPATEKVIGSKNIYDGDQFIHYKTGAPDNNASQTYAPYEITDEATVKLLRDKQFVVSAKYKNYSDDTILYDASNEGFIISITYTHSTKGAHTEYITAVPTAGREDKWIYAWANNDSLLSYYTESELSGITAISIQFRAYSNNGSMIHYDMKNIQIELGSSPTDYEVHDQTVYAYVNGVPLRQVGSVKDEYSSSTGQITRNVVKYEITSTSMNIALWSNSVTENSAGFYIYNFDIFGRQGSPTFKDSLIACSHLTPVDSVYTTKRDDLLGCCWLEAYANPPYIAVKVPQLTTNELNNWLDAEAANGNPVTIWLARMTPITESI